MPYTLVGLKMLGCLGDGVALYTDYVNILLVLSSTDMVFHAKANYAQDTNISHVFLDSLYVDWYAQFVTIWLQVAKRHTLALPSQAVITWSGPLGC